MSGLGGVKSQAAQLRSAQRGVRNKAKQGKALQAKGAKINKPAVTYHLLYMLLTAIASCVVFIPFYGEGGASNVKLTFGILSVFFLLMGAWHTNRMLKKIDWAQRDYRWGEFLLTLSVAVFMATIVACMIYFMPKLTDSINEKSVFWWTMTTSVIFFFIPFFIKKLFLVAMAMDPKRYELWFYPKNYIERQPTWSRERVIFANLNFIRDEKTGQTTTVKAKLPLEANLGELIYLFIADYNNNRSPDNPITNLHGNAKKMGWLFSTPKRFGSKIVLDPKKTIEENGVGEDVEINFERVYE